MGAEPEILTIVQSERGVVLVGEIDASNTATLGASLQALPVNAGAAVEIDMGGVTFIDSSGLRTLVELAQRVQEVGGRLALIDTPRSVARLIDIAELHHLLDVRSGSTS